MLNQLDHIVFENRNKDYGAYPIRRFYHSRVIWAWIITSLAFLIIFGGIFIYYYFKDDSRISPGELMLTYEMMQLSDDIDLPYPPDSPPVNNEETVIPKPDLNTPPEIVNQRVKPIEPEKNKIELNDSTAKTGENLTLKGHGDGTDTGAVYVRVEKIPEFPGGNTTALNKYLRDHIKYPPAAKSKNIGGTVHVSFIVETSGKVNQVKVTKSVEPSIDNEAIRVVKAMPIWSPGRRHGQPVRVILTLPIRFIPT
ncbi:MAG: energy transducer TonB [Bacteroidales bacterium]